MAAALGEPSEDSHKWVEAAMKFYNMEAAKLLKQHGTGLLRSHDQPDQLKMASYTAISPELQFLAYRAANYLPAAAPATYHWGLATNLYTHITSPIRRYADLVNQRALKAILANQSIPPTPPVADHLNMIAKRAKQHDRDLIILRALKSSPFGKTTGTVLELRPLADKQVKLVVYCHAWQLLLRLRYQCTIEGLLISKDEKRTHSLRAGDTVNLLYYADMNARSWKRRMVLGLD
jgi:exoribonuclease R